MGAKVTRFTVATLAACAAFGQTAAEQTVDRLYRFPVAQSDETVQEIIATLAGVTGTTASKYETAFRTITLHGTTKQIALADWLFHEFDQPVLPAQNPPDREYQIPGSVDPEVRVFYWAQGKTQQAANDILASIRTIGDAQQRLFVCWQSRALIVRGTADQIALAEWAFHELNERSRNQEAGRRAPAKYVYEPGTRGETAARIVFLSSNTTQQQMNDILTAVRTIADVPRIFAFTTQALVMRSTEQRIAAAEWVIDKLNRPAIPEPLVQPTAYVRHDPPIFGNELLRVRYLHHQGLQDLFDLSTLTRTISDVPRVFTIGSPSALVFSATADKVALADWLLDELDRAPDDPALSLPRKDPAPYPIHDPKGGDAVVRVLYLNHTTPERINETVSFLRTSGDVTRIVVYRSAGALVFRCRPDQLELAEWLVKEQDKL